ncbi:MAG TPA: non-ribosomal peptide synthetase [Candidatus Acidoferrum sp.]|nr:non-ribosomal peptide synthetase [Candidatus Acidoferrum sp.]
MSTDQIAYPSKTKRALPAPLGAWAGVRSDYPRNKSVAQLFEEVAGKFADRTALVCGPTRMTYGELNGRANGLADRLRQEGVGPETMVGVCIERSVDMIVALIAILKAGGAYVPFDAAYPRERLKFMIGDTKTPVMVTQKSLAPIVVADASVKTILVEDLRDGSGENPPSTTSATNLAYVMYTSGSTGRPKGVLVENRAIVRLVFETNYCKFGPEETFLQFAPISFDASTLEIWGALLHGGKLVVMPPQASSLEEIGRAIQEHGVTTAWLTAGLFHLFVDERLEDLRPLKQLLAGGDTLSAKHVRRVLEAMPQIALINGYGPTEGTTFTCCHLMKAGDVVPDSVPIGKPIANTRVYILNEEMKPVQPGDEGELFAAGDGVARGYLNAPEATEEKFLRDEFMESADARMYRTGDFARWREDGSVEFLGRKDGQTKILGHRIEVGEIEAVLTDHPVIRQACVSVDVDDAGTKRLVAYFVPGDAIAVPAELKSFLAAKLPAYMVPAHYVALPKLPLTSNGKVDRANLPRPVAESTAGGEVLAGNEMEQLVGEIWKKVLRIERAGLDENFFDLGGDSLLLVAVHSQLQKQLGREIAVTDLFDQTTIRSLAKHLGTNGNNRKSFDAAQDRAQKQRAAFAKQRELRVSKPA